MRSVKINIGIRPDGTGVVFVDGHDVSHACRRVSFSAGPGELTKVTLELISEVELDAQEMTYVPKAQLPPNSPLPGR